MVCKYKAFLADPVNPVFISHSFLMKFALLFKIRKSRNCDIWESNGMCVITQSVPDTIKFSIRLALHCGLEKFVQYNFSRYSIQQKGCTRS